MAERCTVVTVGLLTQALVAVGTHPRVEERFSAAIGEALNSWWQTQNWWHRMRTGALDINVFPGVEAATWERREIDDRYATICPTEAWEQLKVAARLTQTDAEPERAPTPTAPAPVPQPQPVPIPNVQLTPSPRPSVLYGVLAGLAMVGAAVWIGRS